MKIVLAYSGGLDTSVICHWLQETYHAEVVTFTADIGQGEEVEPARAKAKALGVQEIYIEDLTDEFVADFVYPMFRANTIYEGEYLLGTSIARPLIAKRLVEIAAETGAEAVSHGATGKGNDQVRFELGAYALNPDIKVISPWREWDLTSREALMDYCARRQIPVDFKQTGEKSPYSMDANLLHISYEGGELEDPGTEPNPSMWRWTVAPEDAPDSSEHVELEYLHGDAVALNGEPMTPARVLARLNEIGGAHGVGRSDIVENRYVGMKSRGCYETPGGTILLKAHRAMESITMDREVMHLRDELMPRLRQGHLQRLLVVAGAAGHAGVDRRFPGCRQRPRQAQALQGRRLSRRPLVRRQPVRRRCRNVRGRRRRLSPGRRRRIHSAQRPAATACGEARPKPALGNPAR